MSDPRELQKLVRDVHHRLQDRRVTIAVAGDMILDNHVEGVPAGMHPDIGVAMLRQATTQESIGGAANIALALHRLGVEVALFGIIGSDLYGRQLENLLDRQPFADYLVTERGWPTPHKDWVYQRQENRLSLVHRVDYDQPLSSTAREELVGEFRAHCPQKVDVLLLADHGLGSVGAETLALVGLAKERRAKVVAIPRTPVLKGQPLDLIVINSPEMRLMYGADVKADPRPLAARYAREYAQDVFLTLLEEGIWVCRSGERSDGTLVPGYPLENAHWMGARDMAASIAAVGLALGLDTLDNARLANAFRYLIACQRGNGRVLWRDMFRFVGLPETQGVA